MEISRTDLADFAYFLAIARQKSFRKAATLLGVTPSALSHAISALEERRGVRLLNRTTRSVTLTAAGEDLFAMIEGPLGQIAEASDNLNRFRDRPAGRVRINVMEDAAALLVSPIVPLLVSRYPEITLDISVTNRMVDVVGQGFDAGIRYGGTVPEDMIAVRLSPPIRWIAAASPGYLAEMGRPAHPQDLRDHRCIGIRLGNDQVYDWEFSRGEEDVAVATPGPVFLNSGQAIMTLGLAGAGMIYGTQPIIQPFIDDGRLERVLPEWSAEGPGFYAYYPSKRQVPAALRLLIDLIREERPLGL